MEKLLSGVGSLLYGMRFTMLFFYVGLVTIIFGILGKFLLETYKLMNTYNLKLKLAFAIISISGVYALKTYLSGDSSLENIQIVTMVAVIQFTLVLSAIGISFAEHLTREKT